MDERLRQLVGTLPHLTDCEDHARIVYGFDASPRRVRVGVRLRVKDRDAVPMVEALAEVGRAAPRDLARLLAANAELSIGAFALDGDVLVVRHARAVGAAAAFAQELERVAHVAALWKRTLSTSPATGDLFDLFND